MREKLVRPTASEDARIGRGISANPDAAPDLSEPVAGIIIRVGRPLKPDRKISVKLRLDRDVVERFKATGAGWQTRINAALKKEHCPLIGRAGRIRSTDADCYATAGPSGQSAQIV